MFFKFALRVKINQDGAAVGYLAQHQLFDQVR